MAPDESTDRRGHVNPLRALRGARARRTEGASRGTGGKRDSFGLMDLLIVMGFAAFFAWYCLVIVGFPTLFPSRQPCLENRIAQLLAFAGMLAGSLLALVSPAGFDRFVYRSGSTVAWTVALCAAPVLVMVQEAGVEVLLPVCLAVMGLSGVSAVYFFTGWEDLCARRHLDSAAVSVGSVMIAGVALFLVTLLFMDPLAQGVMGILFALAAGILFHGVSRRRRSYDRPDDSPIVDRNLSFSKRIGVLLGLVNVPLGFGFSLLYLQQPQWLLVSGGICVVALAAFVLAARAKGSSFGMLGLLRGSIAVSSVCLLAMGVSESCFAVCGAVLFAAWFVQRLAHMVVIMRLTGLYRPSSVYLVVRAKLPSIVGLVVGLAAGTVLAALGFDVSAYSTVSLALMALLAVAALALFPFTDHYDRQLADIPVVIEPLPRSVQQAERARCADLALRHRLSPREEEIVFYLSRGRNAKHIARQLDISESTVKSHIHSVYKKLGIHSRQEFFEIVDELI